MLVFHVDKSGEIIFILTLTRCLLPDFIICEKQAETAKNQNIKLLWLNSIMTTCLRIWNYRIIFTVIWNVSKSDVSRWSNLDGCSPAGAADGALCCLSTRRPTILKKYLLNSIRNVRRYLDKSNEVSHKSTVNSAVSITSLFMIG